MDKTRILPPLVRGNVTGVLDFFVDEIRLFRNILLLTDNFDLVLQIQWWGEVLPAYIRPKKLQVQDRNCQNTHAIESYYHSAKYEIKTTLDLFKLYLKASEVVELSILEAVENYVVGSAFLRDLINLLNKTNEIITLPIFDSLGDQIGDVIIHLNFLEIPAEESKKINPKLIESQSDCGERKSKKQGEKIPNKVQSNFLREKTIFYDGHSKKVFDGEREFGLQFDSQNFKIKKKETPKPIRSETDIFCCKQGFNINNDINGDNELPCKSFPEVKTVNDSSKILYFGANSQQSKAKPPVKNPKIKLPNKFSSNSIKCKSKSKSLEKLGNVSSAENLCKRRVDAKRSLSSKTLTKQSVITDKDKQFDNTRHQQCSSTQQIIKEKQYKPSTSKSDTILNKKTDFCTIPVKESPCVIDYLLGSDMSKDDEKTALNDFKQMSPSHNLVESISQLCLVPDQDTQKSEKRSDISFVVPLKQGHLAFDFENPIERSYYEKFFLNSNSSADFEVAELLNQPENRFTLGMSNPSKATDFKSSSESSSTKNYSFSNTEREVLDDDYRPNSVGGPERKKSCARCKYYKKLDELDTIIESLKHFEEKMISHEKNIQTSLNDNLGVSVKKNVTKYS